MAALRARGEQDEAGDWFVSGQKIFITSGHGKYHFVIARTGARRIPGRSLRGPRRPLDVPRQGVRGPARRHAPPHRHARARRGEARPPRLGRPRRSPSTAPRPQLIGKRGEGFKYMLVLMNNARVGVGFECIGLGEAAYRQARAYAEERRSMGKPIARHEMIADYLDEMATDIQAPPRAGGDGLVPRGDGAEARPPRALRARRHRAREGDASPATCPATAARSRRLTPLLKYLAAEKAVEITRRNMQIHGGVGYTQRLRRGEAPPRRAW